MNENKSLTAQEQKVADLVAKGLSNKKVGQGLGITEKTVKFHLTKVYSKTGLNRYQLIAGALNSITVTQAIETTPSLPVNTEVASI